MSTCCIYLTDKNYKIVAGINSISPNPGLELWLSYLEYIHRKTKDVDNVKLDRIFDQATQQLHGVDVSCKISRWYARILAKRGDMKGARKIWNNILSQQNNKGRNFL